MPNRLQGSAKTGARLQLVSYTINPQGFLNHKRHAHLADMAWLAARREQAQSLPSEPL